MSYALPAGQCYWKFRILLFCFYNHREMESQPRILSGNNFLLILNRLSVWVMYVID